MASEDDDNLAALIAGGGATGGETAAPAGDDAGASAAAAAEPEPDEAAITDEGKAATELDAQYQFRCVSGASAAVCGPNCRCPRSNRRAARAARAHAPTPAVQVRAGAAPLQEPRL